MSTNAELIKAGDRYGRLTVVSLIKEGVYKCGKKYRKWLCVCDCGKTNEVTESNLRCGSVRSCSCLRDELLRDRHLTHGCSMHGNEDRLYRVWTSMKNRCENPRNTSFKYYGEKGVSVCAEWHDYEAFKEWAYKNGYEDSAKLMQCTIDRIDPFGNYEPSNCRWVSMKVQNNNKRSNYGKRIVD